MKGTMSHYWLSLTRGKTLIPVPVKGTIIRLAHFYFAYISLIPVPVKGTITRHLRIDFDLF